MIKHNLWGDVETTGFSSTNDSIVEIGILLEDIEKKNISEFHKFIKHSHYPDHYEKVCKDIHGLYPKRLEEIGESESEVNKQLTEFLIRNRVLNQPARLAGFNVKFDKKFIEMFFSINGFPIEISNIFTSRSLDVLEEVKRAQSLGLFPVLENNKLVTIADHLNIKFDAHSAINDIKTTKMIYDYLENKSQNRV
jgi:DNA polymerase III alpha subunit (gram-positive type)